MKKCNICNQVKTDAEIDSKLIGLGTTPDGWICVECVEASDEAEVKYFGEYDDALRIPEDDDV